MRNRLRQKAMSSQTAKVRSALANQGKLRWGTLRRQTLLFKCSQIRLRESHTVVDMREQAGRAQSCAEIAVCDKKEGLKTVPKNGPIFGTVCHMYG